MIPVPDFTAEDLARLRGLPRHHAADMMLRGEAGPMSRLHIGGYDDATAALSYLVFLAYLYGRAAGHLSGRPGYEARETLASRVRSAATRATDLRSFAEELWSRRGVGVSLDRLRGADWMWWRQTSATFAGAWPTLRGRLTDAIAGAGLLIDWLYDTDVRAALAATEEGTDAA